MIAPLEQVTYVMQSSVAHPRPTPALSRLWL